MLESNIPVKTDNFDGPLGLLLLLIQKQELNIRELNLTTITRQYLEYLDKMIELNFDVAGDYLYMAATLILLKSKSCVSEEDMEHLLGEDLEDVKIIKTKTELIERLEELYHFQVLGQKIWSLPRRGEEIFVKPKVNRRDLANSLFVPMEPESLVSSMMSVMERIQRRYKVVKRDRLSIKEKLLSLKKFLSLGSKLTFQELLNLDPEQEKKAGRITNVVISFISLLELARLRCIHLFQNQDLGDVYIDVVSDLQKIDVENANGFEEPATEVSAPQEVILQ